MTSTGFSHAHPGDGRPGPGHRIAVGDTVVAEDGPVGRVEQILCTESSEPRFVVVAVRDRFRRRHPVVPCGLVARVDSARREVHARARRTTLSRMSEAVPIVL